MEDDDKSIASHDALNTHNIDIKNVGLMHYLEDRGSDFNLLKTREYNFFDLD